MPQSLDGEHAWAVAVKALVGALAVSITEERIRSNLSKTKNIPPKAVISSDFCCTFAMSLMILLVLICSTKVSEISDMAKS